MPIALDPITTGNVRGKWKRKNIHQPSVQAIFLIVVVVHVDINVVVVVIVVHTSGPRV